MTDDASENEAGDAIATLTAFGTAAPDAPVSRSDFERAVRSLNASDLALRDVIMQLAARVVALTDELTRRVDGVEPQPAAPNTPAAPPETTLEDAVDAAMDRTLTQIRAHDLSTRVAFDLIVEDKYQTPSPDVPCDELIPICGARCCTLSFALTPADLDEGVIRWDYGQPYLIAQRASDGYCVHNAPGSRGCTVHSHRPRVCRTYDCREDKRIWSDYANRILATADDLAEVAEASKHAVPQFNLVERAKRRAMAVLVETRAVTESCAESAPRPGPAPVPFPSQQKHKRF